MRGREFTMKDAYSFDRDVDAARAATTAMYDAYARIFDAHGADASAPSPPTPARSAAIARTSSR